MKKNGVNLVDDGHFSGTTTSSLTIYNALPADNGTYTVVVSNPCSSVTSQPATLTVNSGPFVEVAAGGYHSLVRKTDGTVWSSGHNGSGQLGDGTTVAKWSRVVQVSGLTGVIRIGAGRYHSMAIKNNGTAWGWGENANGELGDGTQIKKLTPVQITGLSSMTVLVGGNSHSLGLRSDGTVWAWGRNTSGQLGDGTTIHRSTPVQVGSLSGMSMVAAGENHSLAGEFSGAVWGWGANGNGQLGNGTQGTETTPVQTWFWGATGLAAGYSHSLVATTDGYVLASGANYSGQLGDGTRQQSLWPVYANNLNGVVQIAASYNTSYAVTGIQAAWGWGFNAKGMLGDGANITYLSPALTTDFGPAHINEHPVDRSVCPGHSTSLSVRAKGSPTLTYQWKLWGSDIPGATGSTYTITSATFADEGYYTVDVTNPCGMATSQSAYVSIGGPIITTQPQSQTTPQYDQIEIDSKAMGSAPLSYQWYFNGSPIPGGTNAIYKKEEAYLSDAGEYYVIVTGPCGSTQSQSAYLTVNP